MGNFISALFNNLNRQLNSQEENQLSERLVSLAKNGDAMVDSVTVDDGYLVITFNTAAGKQPIRIPLTSLTATILETTYADLVAARDGGTLVKGTWYRITDYVTTTATENTRSARHQFDVVVLATDTNRLSEDMVFAMPHAGDTYFTEGGAHPEGWTIKYCLDNDTDRFLWADTENGKGVIYYMKDEWGNECPYDFKNIQFKRWAISNITSEKTGVTTDLVNSLKSALVYNASSNPRCFSYQSGNYSPIDDITVVVNSSISAFYYTFSMVTGLEGIADASLAVASSEGGDFGVYDNKIGIHRGDDIDVGMGAQGIVGGNVFLLQGNGYCYGNKLGTNCSDNTFGNYCYNNTFGNYVQYNTFGNYCYNNTFGNDCSYNTFGNSCYGNTFGNDCCNNTFGNSCSGNTFGNYCSDNTFGNNCYYNTFGNDCCNNTFGNSCYGNTFGNYCYNNTFGNSCSGNTFGNSCSGNTFGNGENIKSYYQYFIVENGCCENNFNCTQTTSSSSKCQNVKVTQGVSGETIDISTVNQAFQTVVKKDDSTEIIIS